MLKFAYTFILFFCCSAVFAQTSTDSTTSSDPQAAKGVDFTVMPFLSYNKTLQFMFGAIPMMMYKIDKDDSISPKSLSGLSAVYTTNKSYFVAFFNKIYFKEDKWRAHFFAMIGNKNAQFFMDDFDEPGFYDYSTKTILASAGIQRKIFKSVYGGFSYTYAHYNTDYEDNVQPASITKTNGLELNLLHDTRDAIYYPTHGDKTRLRWVTYPEWFGNDVNANKVNAEYNKYFAIRHGTDVLAARFSGKFGLGNIAFEQQVTIGGKDIRGYSEGKYRGDGLMALQAEYRYNFNKKLGMVGFAGLATLYGSDTKDFNWGLYPGVGAGFRYRAFKTVKFNVGVDGAAGKDDWGVYFRIGEAF